MPLTVWLCPDDTTDQPTHDAKPCTGPSPPVRLGADRGAQEPCPRLRRGRGGRPHRAFYGNQYSLTFPLFEHFQVPLWVPEVGGAIDPANEAHDLIMGVFGGLSKGERNRIKIRVRSAMAAITATESRYLGGRPPYGYELIDAGPHPNPAKAADGKRLRRLVGHPAYSLVVKWIFAQFIGERGTFEIAEELTREGVPSPSAADPDPNRHRVQVAWSKSVVPVILIKPRYTGRQVWNKQRTVSCCSHEASFGGVNAASVVIDIA